jgi:hypothetical protein
MRAVLLPVLFVLVGLGAGVGGGLALRPEPEVPAAKVAPPLDRPTEFVRLANQFVVPLVSRGRVDSVVVMSLGVEVTAGMGAMVHAREPKLRDAFLQVLFDHANVGGFRGVFTEGQTLLALRTALREAAVRVLGPDASDVLIMDLVRQDS